MSVSQNIRQFIPEGDAILESVQGVKVLVLGDLMIDEYIWGDVTRVSPEAPVPIVGVRQETLRLGGAANVAHNIIAMGGKVELCGQVGDDQMGRWMISDLKSRSIGLRGVLSSPDRPTTVKTRVIAHNQQVVRVDREDTTLLPREDEEMLLSAFRSLLPECGAVVISDYAKGVVTPTLIKSAVTAARDAGLPVAVDPKVNHFATYRDVTVLTPNLLEASAGAGIIIDSMEALLKAGSMIMEKLGSENLIITRGDQGMTLFARDKDPMHIPALSREVYDVTGAGDTVISAVSLGLAAGISIQKSAALANVAAGVVVGEVGTVPITRDQLRERIRELGNQAG
jgi:D-beta-D-heptose 7-phosphate kinase/D-beta-D-heptose 1-phosphate adenosyltransferase